MTKQHLLSRVRSLSTRLGRAEATAARLRAERNGEMRKAMTLKDDPATEREAAEAASVTPAYAHRIKVEPPVASAA